MKCLVLNSNLLQGGTGRLRMVEIISCKIFSLSREEATLESLQSAGTKNYRLEEVPKDQAELGEGDVLVPVAHFSKEVFSTFGSPFLVLLRQGDTVGRVKERMQERLGVGDKEWDKYRVAFVIQGKPHYVEEDDKVINTKVRELVVGCCSDDGVSGVPGNGPPVTRAAAGWQALDRAGAY